jgi:hypothetical protein
MNIMRSAKYIYVYMYTVDALYSEQLAQLELYCPDQMNINRLLFFLYSEQLPP